MNISPLPAISTRFGVVSVLPTMVLLGWSAFLFLSGAISGYPQLQPIWDTLESVSVPQLALATLIGIVVGSVLHPFQILLVRMLEGYWEVLPILRRLQYLGMEINRRRMRRLYRAGRKRDCIDQYPPDTADFLPTRVGNALRAAERRAGEPFGMDAIVMLPRLYPLASAATVAFLADLRNQLDVAARYCVVLALISVSGLATMATDGLWLLVPAIASALTWASYSATIRTALSYGRGLRVFFELEHGKAVEALGWEVPADLDRLRDLSDNLRKWLDEGGPAPSGYIGRTAQHREREQTSINADTS